jgi:hypothetical protein
MDERKDNTLFSEWRPVPCLYAVYLYAASDKINYKTDGLQFRV